jgi:hypothetical protein
VRATRAYLAGFGTAGSLLAGAAFLFVLASALVSFHGWPQIAGRNATTAVVVSATPHHGARASVSAPRLTAALASTAPARPAGPIGANAGNGGPAGPVRHTTSGATSLSGSQVASTAPGATPVACTSGCPTRTGPISGLGGTVDTTASALGSTVNRTGSQLGQTVTTVTGTLAGTVSKVSGTLGSTVNHLGQALGSTVAKTGAALGGTVTTAGRQVGKLLSSLP